LHGLGESRAALLIPAVQTVETVKALHGLGQGFVMVGSEGLLPRNADIFNIFSQLCQSGHLLLAV